MIKDGAELEMKDIKPQPFYEILFVPRGLTSP